MTIQPDLEVTKKLEMVSHCRVFPSACISPVSEIFWKNPVEKGEMPSF